MKKLFVLLVFGIFALGLSAPALVQAQSADNATVENILGESAGALPDSPFYGLKKFGEGIQLFFTFDKVEKVKLKYRLAQLRLMEADAMARLNKTRLAENALSEYAAGLNETEDDENSLSAAGRNVSSIADLIGNNTYRHILVLQKVYNKVPDSAKPAIKKVLENSMTRQEKIAEKIADNNTVNITITVGNETVTREVPAAFAEKFLETAREMRKKIGEEVNIENNTDLKEHIAEKTGINMEKAREQIADAREQINEISQKLASLNVTNLAADKLLQNAEAHLNKSEQAFGAGKYGEAFGQAISAEAVAMSAKKLAAAREKIGEKKTEMRKIVSEKAETGNAVAKSAQVSNMKVSTNQDAE